MTSWESHADAKYKVTLIKYGYDSVMHFLAAKAQSLLLIVISIALALGVVELTYRSIYSGQVNANSGKSNRYMLFGASSAGSAFQNLDTIFTYKPNAVIHAEAFYDIKNTLLKEYDYQFKTNNLGLVQGQDVDLNKESLLLLGDSFTEGQGASPWFERLVQTRKNGLQLINGGLLGTGFEQWGLLHDHLIKAGVKVKKVAVIFISDDYRRTVWNFPAKVSACLSKIENCVGDEGYFPIPPDQELMPFLQKLKDFRTKEYALKDARQSEKWIRRYLSSAHHAWEFSKEYFQNHFRSKSPEVIERLKKKYGDDVLYIHPPTKDEILAGNQPDDLGLLARERIRQQGGKIFDGFTQCGLNATDFYQNDPHPNESGYAKIEQCVSRVLVALQ